MCGPNTKVEKHWSKSMKNAGTQKINTISI